MHYGGYKIVLTFDPMSGSYAYAIIQEITMCDTNFIYSSRSEAIREAKEYIDNLNEHP